MSKKIILAGASGLIGGQVMRLLAERLDPLRLHIVGRRKLEDIPEGIVQHVGDPKIWPMILETLGFDVAISCLGTTIKTAGSQAAFAAIDRDLVLDFARIVKGDGTPHFITVSSVGASAKAGNFYLSVKGEAEDGLRAAGFERLDILRPGLLRGDRQEHRSGESLAIAASPFMDMLLHGPLRRYRSIDSAAVARAIVHLALDGGGGQFIHENDAMLALAG